MHSKLNSEVFIDKGPQPRLLRPEASDTLLLRWSSESPLIAAGEKIYVISDGPGDLVKFSPESDKRIPMTAAGRAEWKVDALKKNGVVKLTVMGEKTGELAEIEYVVMHPEIKSALGVSVSGMPLVIDGSTNAKVKVGDVFSLEAIGCFGGESSWRASFKGTEGGRSAFRQPLRVGFENGLATFEVDAVAGVQRYAFVLHYKGCLDIEFSDGSFKMTSSA